MSQQMIVRLFAGVLVMFAVYFYGAASYKHSLPPLKQFVEARNYLLVGIADVDLDRNPLDASSDTSGRQQVDCTTLRGSRTAVLFTSGQSNAANRASEDEFTREARGNVFNVWQGKCYRAVEPLLGTDGLGANVWVRVAEELLERGDYENIVIAATARGGSSMRRWTPERNELFPRIKSGVDSLRSAGLTATHFLWFQGESDWLTDPAAYISDFNAFQKGVRALGIHAPIIVSVTTLCQNYGSAKLRQAQRSLPDLDSNIFVGPNTDEVDNNGRFDGCHLNERGKSIAGKMWADSIEAVTPPQRKRSGPYLRFRRQALR